MRLVERISDLDGNRQRVVEGERPFLESRRERFAIEVRHDQIVRAIDDPDVVDTADVRMVKRGDSARLALETCPQVRIACERTAQNLDRNRAIESRVAGFVDLAHPAITQRGDDFIGTEPGAGREGHETPCWISVRWGLYVPEALPLV